MSLSPNSFGTLFRFTSFGESHGPAMGVVVEGCPSGVTLNMEFMNDFLQRRRPGESALVSQRQEADNPEILSGVFEGKTLGTPVAIIVKNVDQKSEDYSYIKNNPRVGHADDVWKEKFSHVDYRGGGRSSGRETLSRVLAAAVAKSFVSQIHPTLNIHSKILSVGPLSSNSKSFQADLEALLVKAKEEGESYGGHAELKLCSVPKGLGEPVFMKLKSELSSALMSIGAVVGIEFGNSFENVLSPGTVFHSKSEQYSGIRGGISTGEDITLKIAVKPTSSILDTAKKGRHDPCILLRALVVFEAMVWLVIADLALRKRLNKI